jgi:5'-nucleotidase
VQILLTNDDGIYAPGLMAMKAELVKLGDVTVVAPETEQSGVGHSITFLRPLLCKEVFDGDEHRGWAVDGSPADCVKLAVSELCPTRPALIVSGINHGLNAGINVLYSGTVGAAIEGAFFGLTSVAVSLEHSDHSRFDHAAVIARGIIEEILENGGASHLYNLNIPTVATQRPSQLQIVPMGTQRYGEDFISRLDPKGRKYYWATGEPAPRATDHESDVMALKRGCITLTPLDYDMTQHHKLTEIKSWDIQVDAKLFTLRSE